MTITETTKKIIFIIFFIVFTISTGYALYFFFFKPTQQQKQKLSEQEAYKGQLNNAKDRTTQNPNSTSNNQQNKFNTLKTSTSTSNVPSKLKTIYNGVAKNMSPDQSGNIRFYDPFSGKFYKIDENGNKTLISNQSFPDVKTINWSPRKDEVILEFPDNSKIFYDFENKRQVKLPNHWKDFEFSPIKDEIVAKSIGLNRNNRFLISSQPDGNKAQAIYQLGDNQNLVIPTWSPNNQIIAFSKTGRTQSSGEQSILLLGKNHENFQSLIVPGYGFQPQWSPTGKQLLYSVYRQDNQNKPMLWVSGASGKDINRNRTKLNINTWADKCAWENESTIYCGVPIKLGIGAGFSKEAFQEIPDNIYKIDLKTHISNKIDSNNQELHINHPIIKNNKFIFTDPLTGKIQSYSL